MRLDQVPDYIVARLRTVTEVEAAAAVVARHRWLTEPAARTPAMREVDAAWRVRTLSDALREASDLLGRSYLRTAAAVWPLSELRKPAGPWCRAVVVGATGADAGLSAEELARLIGFEDVQTVIAAALKLQPFDPSQGVAWAAAREVEVEELGGPSEHVDGNGGDPRPRCAADRGVGSAAPPRRAAVVPCLAGAAGPRWGSR